MSVDATATPALPKFEVVFLDMDGVLADFQGAACRTHSKLPVADLIRLRHWEPQEWLMWKVFGVTQEKFWQLIDEAPNFWHDMPKTSFCDAIVNLARGLSDTVRVLSTPHDNDNSYAGKRHWCRFNLPGIKVTLNEDEPGQSSKALLAKPGRLLLDDSDKNCDAFRAAGGSAILIPQHWNSAHDKAPYGVLFYLAMELEKLRREQVIAAAYPLSSDRLIGTQDTSDAEIDAAQRAGMRRIVALSSPRALAGKFADAWKSSPPLETADCRLQIADSPIAKVLDAAGELESGCIGSDAEYRAIQQELAMRRQARPAGSTANDHDGKEAESLFGPPAHHRYGSHPAAEAEPLPATLLGYPVLPAETNSPLAQQIAELQPGDIVLGPSLSAGYEGAKS